MAADDGTGAPRGLVAKLRGRRLLVLSVLLPAAIALHVYLVWLGGGWRLFALIELAVGGFVALAMREAKRLDGAR